MHDADRRQADRRADELPAAQAERRRSVAERRGLHEVVGLNHDLGRQAGGERAQNRIVFDRLLGPRAHADQTVGEARRVVRVEAVDAEILEEGVVARFAVRAVDLQLGHRDRLGDLGHFRQPLAMGRDGVGAIVEDEGVGLGDAEPLVAFADGRIEALRLERREQPAKPPPPRLGQRGVRRRLGEHSRHNGEVEAAALRGSERGREPFRAQPFLRADEIGPEDVGELHDERVDFVAERARLRLVRRLPEVADEAERHGPVAVDEVAIGLERGANALQAVGERRVRLRRQPVCGAVEQIRQRLRSALHHQRADLPFEAEGVRAQPLAVGAAGDVLQDAVDQAAERLHRRRRPRRCEPAPAENRNEAR